jgi:phospholipase/carboxylesterase
MELIHTLYEPAGKGPHPTILTLHGRGASAFDLLSLASHLCGGRCLMICPQGPLETPIGPEATGYAWYPMSMGGPPDIGSMLVSRQRLQQFLDDCLEHYPIDAKKLAIVGFSQGGVMAYSLALANPERFAALVTRQFSAGITDIGSARHSGFNDRSRTSKAISGNTASSTDPANLSGI